MSTLQEAQDKLNQSMVENAQAVLGKNTNSKDIGMLLQNISGSAKKTNAPRLAFAEQPNNADNYAGIYKFKKGLLPDYIIKQVRVQNHLVAGILRARGNHMSMFGHVRKDRFDIGLEIDIRPELRDFVKPEQMVVIQERINEVLKIFVQCGHVTNVDFSNKTNLSEFLDVSTKNGLSFGRFATEIVYEIDEQTKEKKFHSYRVVDAGTIYKTIKNDKAADSVRQQSIRLIEQLTNQKIDPRLFSEDKYSWVQVIDGTIRQAFSPEELLVCNMYPSSDVEHNGYPVTPLDTVIVSVTTHSSVEVYNKLYFQNGRAARGMMVIKSDEIDQSTIEDIKQQFNASINNVANSFRTPIFGVSKEDEVTWVSTQPQKKDGEFQYLFDQTTRNILMAFGMSPDELPGFGHLSRSTNQQSMSECFDINQPFLTDKGRVSALELLKDQQETNIKVWTGKKWEFARVFRTGPKQLAETSTIGGLKVATSLDHRFMAIGEDGQPEWKQQKDLQVGDYLLVNKQPTIGEASAVPVYNNKSLNEDIVELLGWMTGDGCMIAPKKRAGGFISLFYHPTKELDVRDRHLKTLNEFGINAFIEDKEVTREEQEIIKNRYGFKSVSGVRRGIKIYDTSFVKFLMDNGVKTSKEGKSIPAFLHLSPISIRSAFLRGLFSADGHVTINGQVMLTIQADHLREDVIKMLYDLGIRANGYKYMTRPLRTNLTGESERSYKISVRDTNEYWALIGFIQEHKKQRQKNRKWQIEEVPSASIKFICNNLLLLNEGKNLLSRNDKNAIRSYLNNEGRCFSFNRLKKISNTIGYNISKWLEDYSVEKIERIDRFDRKIEMVDVEVYDNTHAFSLNGFIVHNSSNEYKMTAARDIGLRPLILKIQDFFNDSLFPIIDAELSQLCYVAFAGFDAETKEQESSRLIRDMPIHYTYDEVMEDVDKQAIGVSLGGGIPFNEHYQEVSGIYVEQNKLAGEFLNSPAAFVDPLLKYRRDQFFATNLQTLMQVNPIAVQAYYATRSDALEVLKMLLEDYLEEME